MKKITNKLKIIINENLFSSNSEINKLVYYFGIVIFILYFVGAELSTLLRFHDLNINIINFTAPILMVTLLFTRLKRWIIYLPFFFIAELIFNLLHGYDILTSIGLFIAVLLQAFISIFCLKVFIGSEKKIFKINNFFIVVLCVFIAAPIISSTFGIVFYEFDHKFEHLINYWIIWSMSNILTQIIIFPILALSLIDKSKGLKLKKSIDYLILLLAFIFLIIFAVFGFGYEINTQHEFLGIMFLPFILLLLLSIKFGVRYTCFGIFLLFVIFILMTNAGYNILNQPFKDYSISNLQLFFIVFSLPVLYISIIIRQLKISEERFKNSANFTNEILDTIPHSLFEIDINGKFIFINKYGMEYFGYDKYDIEQGLYIHNVLPKNEIIFFQENFEKIFNSEKKYFSGFIYTIKKKDGNLIKCQSYGIPIIVNNIKKFRGIIIDETETVKAKEALRICEERLNIALDISKDAIWDWDLISNQAYFSPKYYTMLGYLPYEFPNNYDAFKQITYQEDIISFENYMYNGIKNKQNNYEIRFRMVAKDGSVKWILGRAKAIEWDEKGYPKRLVGINTDISDILFKENELQKIKTLYSILFNHLYKPTAIFETQLDSPNKLSGAKYVEINEQWEKLVLSRFYYTKEDVIGKELNSFQHSTLFNKYEKVIEEVIKNNGNIVIEDYLDTENNERIYFKLSVLSAGYQLFVFVIEDLTKEKLAEIALKERETLVNSIFNATYDVSFVLINFVDDDYRIVEFSPGSENIFGYSKNEIIFKPVSILHSSDDFNYFNEVYQNVQHNKDGYTSEKSLIRKNKEVFPALVKIFPILGEDSNIKYILEVSLDVSLTKRLEKELFLKSYALESSSFPIGLADLNGRITYVNKAFLNTWGYTSSEEIIGLDIRKFGFIKTIEETIEKIMVYGHTSGEGFARKKDNSLVDIQYFVSLVKDINNKPLHIIASFIDISERKQAERALIEKDRRYSLITTQTGQIIYDFDIQSGEIKWYGAIEEVMGYKFEEFEKFNYNEWEKSIHPDDVAAIVEKLEAAMNKGDKFQEEYRIKKKNGDYIFIENIGIFIVDNNNKPFKMLGVVKDISSRKIAEHKIKTLNLELEEEVEEKTQQLQEALIELNMENEERKKTEEQLFKAKIELSRALKIEKDVSELKSRFIDMVSHEYKTPLTIIMSASYLLDQFFDIKDKEQHSKYVNRIQIAVDIMNQLLEDVLFLGQTEIEKLQPKFTNIDINQVIFELIESCKFVDKGNHNIEYIDYPLTLHFKTDKKFFQQIFSNLIRNSIKYSQYETNIFIESNDYDDYISISIQDEGIGIPKDEQAYLFEPFHRFSNVGVTQGSGLGLAIVKRCINALNGKIEFDSDVDKGSKFVVILPKNVESKN